jgi:hypothetical protein
MTFLMWNLRSLIFDFLSFTEGLITALSMADWEAPPSSRTFVTSVCPNFADRCRGVQSYNNKFKTIFKHKQFLIKSSQTTKLHTTKVFYKEFNCHHHINRSCFETNLFKIKIFWFSSITRLKPDPTRRF